MPNSATKSMVPDVTLARVAIAMSVICLGALLVTGLVALPTAPIFVGLLFAGRARGRINERLLTIVCNIFALIFILSIGMLGLGRGMLETFIETLPYMLLSVQTYYLLRPSLEDRFYYFGITSLMILVQSALVVSSSLFVLLFSLMVLLLLKGAGVAEEVRLRRAVLQGEDVRAAGLFSFFNRRRMKREGVVSARHLIVPGVRATGHRRVGAFGLVMLAIALIFMALPRTQMAGTIDALTPRSDRAEVRERIGFTEEVSHGRFGSLADDDTVVMTVNLDRKALGEPVLRWRGRGLNRFDGKSWTADTGDAWTRWHFDGWRYVRTTMYRQIVHPDNRERYYFLGSRFRQDAVRANLIPARFRLALKGVETVFTPPRPAMITAFSNAYLTRDFTGAFHLEETLPRNEALHYTVMCQKASANREQRIRAAQEFTRTSKPRFAELFLHLPDDLDARFTELGKRLTAGKSPYESVRAVIDHLESTCTYSLAPETTPSGDDPLADFLFGTRTGHCEYFASAMAVLLRVRGIPSRVVAGFQAGEWNELGSFYTVRQRDAHAWVEAWFAGVGWVPYDPAPRSAENSAFLNRRGWWQSNVMPVIRYLDDKYYSYVMNYNRSSQENALKKMAGAFDWATGPLLRAASWITDNPIIIIVLAILGLSGAAIWLGRGWRRRGRDGTRLTTIASWQTSEVLWGKRGRDIARAYYRARDLLDPALPENAGTLTAREMLHIAVPDGPACERIRLALNELTTLYERARFASHDFTERDLRRARALMAEIKNAQKQKKGT